LDRASDTRVHFQDIGNPLISGQVYKRISTPVLLSKADIAADLYEQEITRVGTESHKRLSETETLADLLGVDRDRLPCIAFRTVPFDDVVTLDIAPGWYVSESARWNFIDTLKSWLVAVGDWLTFRDPPTTHELREQLKEKLSDLTHNINEGTSSLPPETPIPDEEKSCNRFLKKSGAWLTTFDDVTVPFQHRKGFLYIAELLNRPRRPVCGNGVSEAVDSDTDDRQHEPQG